jgi:hypothetical protein
LSDIFLKTFFYLVSDETKRKKKEKERAQTQKKTKGGAMAPSSIIRNGYTFRGIGVLGRGVFTDRAGDDCEKYAGQIKEGFACGLGVLDFGQAPCSKLYAEHGPDGKEDGRSLFRYATRDTVYVLRERGRIRCYAELLCDGRLRYNGSDCAPDDPRALALMEQVAPVEALANAAAVEAADAVANMAALDLMIAVLLARYREPTVASELAAELLTLPSGLLAIVCEAIMR